MRTRTCAILEKNVGCECCADLFPMTNHPERNICLERWASVGPVCLGVCVQINVIRGQTFIPEAKQKHCEQEEKPLNVLICFFPFTVKGGPSSDVKNVRDFSAPLIMGVNRAFLVPGLWSYCPSPYSLSSHIVATAQFLLGFDVKLMCVHWNLWPAEQFNHQSSGFLFVVLLTHINSFVNPLARTIDHAIYLMLCHYCIYDSVQCHCKQPLYNHQKPQLYINAL